MLYAHAVLHRAIRPNIWQTIFMVLKALKDQVSFRKRRFPNQLLHLCEFRTYTAKIILHKL